MGLSIPFKPGWANLIFRGRLDYVYVMLGFLVLVMVISYAIEKSRLGFYMTAMREDEDAAESLGINTLQLRITATLISAFLTAIGGTLYSQYILYIEPHSVFRIVVFLFLISSISSKIFWTMRGANPSVGSSNIHKIHQSGVTILAIEHIMTAIMKLSQRIIVLHHGQKIADGMPGAITKDENVIQAYLGEKYVA